MLYLDTYHVCIDEYSSYLYTHTVNCELTNAVGGHTLWDVWQIATYANPEGKKTSFFQPNLRCHISILYTTQYIHAQILIHLLLSYFHTDRAVVFGSLLSAMVAVFHGEG